MEDTARKALSRILPTEIVECIIDKAFVLLNLVKTHPHLPWDINGLKFVHRIDSLFGMGHLATLIGNLMNIGF